MICMLLLFIDLVAQGFGCEFLVDRNAIEMAMLLEVLITGIAIGIHLTMKGN